MQKLCICMDSKGGNWLFTVSFIAVCTGKSFSCLYLCIRHSQGPSSLAPQDPIPLFWANAWQNSRGSKQTTQIQTRNRIICANGYESHCKARFKDDGSFAIPRAFHKRMTFDQRPISTDFEARDHAVPPSRSVRLPFACFREVLVRSKNWKIYLHLF